MNNPLGADGAGDATRTVAVLGVLAVATLILFHPVIFGGRVLLDPSPFRYDPWRCYAGADDLESEMHQGDNLRGYLPRQFDLWRSVRSGRVPLWNPHAFGGTPFLADPQTRVAYPVSLLLAGLEPTRAMGYDIAIHVWLAMAGMYLLMRVVGATTTGALVGAVAYGFSSFIYTHFGHPTFVASAAWIPFFFYGFEKAQVAERRGTCILAVSLALGFLAGFPQVFLFGVASLAVYAIYMSAHHAACRRWAEALRNLRVLAVSGTLGLLAVSVTLVPFLEFLRNSTGLGIPLEKMESLHQAPPLLLLRSLFPDFFGNPVDRTDWSIVLARTRSIHVSLFQVYCGAGSLVAAASGLVFIRRSKYVGAFLVLLALSVAVAVSPEVLRVAYRFALASYSNIDRVAVVSCFALAAMAGVGFSLAWGGADARHRRRVALALAAAAAAVVALSAYFAVEGPSLIRRAASEFASLPDGMRLHPWTLMRSGRIFEWSLDAAGRWLWFEKTQVAKGLAFTLVGTALLALCVTLQAGRRLRRLAGLMFLASLLLDLSLIARTYSVNQPTGGLSETDGIRFLKEVQGADGLWRIQCISSVGTASYPYETVVLPPNLNQVFGISSLQGTYTMAPAARADFRRLRKDRLPITRAGDERSEVFPPLNMPLATMMSVRHLVDAADAPVHTASPVLEAVARAGRQDLEPRLLRFGDDTRLALEQTVGRPVGLEVELPGPRRLDLCLGLAASEAASGDSLEAVVTCEGAAGSVQCRRRFGPATDRGAWHKMSLDLPAAGDGPCRLSLCVYGLGNRSPGVTAGWSGFELVRGDCRVTGSADGYEVLLGSAPGVLSLELTSRCRQVPLEAVSPEGHRVHRWVAFPDGMSSRQVRLGAEALAGNTVVIRSDSAFHLAEARKIDAVPDCVNYDLIYDRDMKIYENFAATEKCVCVDRAAVPHEASRGGNVLRLADLGSLDGARCGSARIVNCRQETIVIETRSDRACYLCLQDTYYPGWKAYVDGARADVLRTDLGTRAVGVPAGAHRVVFKFDPASFKVGLAGSSLGVVLLALYAGNGLRRRRPSRPRHPGAR